ncbi:MAG: gamma-glutamyltransferase [Phycisphaerae bacterium]|nr:gamma-glutamyltransferase [Phycisphaerae bacterium]|tara:strand:+ start:10280 stop:11833 length:1554 start_codon:yes stop_codon:yes gene_type:complete
MRTDGAASMVATSQPDAVRVGVDILSRGGNAVDAAIAAAMALTVVEPCSNGIGSDAFALVWMNGSLHGLNASGRSPAAWGDDVYCDRDRMPIMGWEAVTVPGAVSGWVALQKRFGSMDLPTLAEGAIRLARDGYVVTPLTAASWARSATRFGDFDPWLATFAPDGRPPAEGERFLSPDHAATLAAIAETGGESFYRGELAHRMAEDARAHGAALVERDLAEHAAMWCEPMASPAWNGRTLHELPPNGQGLVALVAAGILERIGHVADGPFDPLALHLQIEAMKCAFSDIKAVVGDPSTMTVDPAALLTSSHLDAHASKIDPDVARDPGHVVVSDASTVYLSCADADGNMVSFIQSNYMGFGSGVVIPGTGIAMQNRGAGFVLADGHPNRAGGGKRPYHTIIPGFITRDGMPEISFGVMGGHMQPQGHVQVGWRMLELGMHPQAALDAPRWRIAEGRQVHLEPGFPQPTIDALTARGHELDIADACTVAFGGGQIIRRTPEGCIGGSDPRRDGCIGAA